MSLNVQIVIASYTVLLLIFLLSRKTEQAYNQVFSVFIGAILFGLSMDILTELQFLTDRINYNSFVGYLYGPLLLLYVRLITNVGISKTYLHFIPAIGVLLIEVIDSQVNLLNAFPTWKVIAIGMLLHASFYAFIIFQQVKKVQANTKLKHLFAWLSLLKWGFIVLLLGYTLELVLVFQEQFEVFYMVKTSNLIVLAIYMNGIVYFGLSNAYIFNKKQKYAYSNLSKQQITKLAQVLEKYMLENKPHLSFELNLKNLAGQTKMDASQLSQVINEHFGLNFKDFINFYRIENAKELLSTQDDMLTKEIMYESGFQSKSTFNYAFKKNTGMSPSEFRESMKIKS